jgi:predicted phosphate transport protein (TIGR00153 family)
MRFLPREEKFFVLLAQHAKLVGAAGHQLLDGVKSGNMKEAAERIRQQEEEGDKLLREVVSMLGRSFITPLDPEDIHGLSSSLDDVLDDIEEVAYRLANYNVDLANPNIRQLAHQVDASTIHLAEAFANLEKHESLSGPCQRIHVLEEEADDTLRRATMELFEKESANPILVFKLKEIYEMLELATDRAADVADVLENVQVKHN